MIRLPNDYAITADENQYVLERVYIAGPNVKPPRKPGEEYTVPLGYYATVAGALQGVIKRLQRDSVAKGDVSTLEEAAGLFRRIHDETISLVFPGEGAADVECSAKPEASKENTHDFYGIIMDNVVDHIQQCYTKETVTLSDGTRAVIRRWKPFPDMTKEGENG